MDLGWIAIAFGDVVWISLAFVLGMISRVFGLPPLVGFLVAGFALNAFGFSGGETLNKLSDLGITLLLFTVGLKLNLRTLAKPHVWAVTGIHTVIIVSIISAVLYGLAIVGARFVADLSLQSAILIAFALSFSSTVFVVKSLEDKGDLSSLHGRIAIGILIMQDIAAVVFLAASTGKMPSEWAFMLLLLIPLRPIFAHILQRVGHGELLVLYGFILAMGGAEAFELVGLKGDLGALALGVMIASHPKSDEMAKTMLGFKDLFLLGFFLSIGLSGQVTADVILWGILLTPLIFLKTGLFFALLTGFSLRARTGLLASLSLSNFSEFGLIVATIGVANGWLEGKWLIVIAVAMSLSFAVAALINTHSHQLYTRYRDFWKKLQRSDLLTDDKLLDIEGATVAVIGMGGIGTGAFDSMEKLYGKKVVGIDIDPVTVNRHTALGRHILMGDPSDADFWDRMQEAHTLEQVMLALPRLAANLAVLEQLNAVGFKGRIAATAKFPDDVSALKEAGADSVFNIYSEAGAGFAGHVALPEEVRARRKP